MPQLKSILSYGERIQNGNDSETDIENYARYAMELTSFISQHIKDVKILELNSEIPKINYKRNQYKLYQLLFSPEWLTSLFHGSYAKRKSLNEIKLAHEKFASIAFLTYPFTEEE